MNHTSENYVINPGDKIAQLVFNKYERIKWQDVDELPTTERGEGGFGHTGK
jgi:dUTP pyrophosphatase